MTYDHIKLPAELPLEDELLARQRAIRAIDVRAALAEGFARFLAVETFDCGPDDRIVAWRDRVSWDHPLLQDRPGSFIPAMSNPLQKSLYEPEGDDDGSPRAA